jgi:hypothetical protein
MIVLLDKEGWMSAHNIAVIRSKVIQFVLVALMHLAKAETFPLMYVPVTISIYVKSA